MGGRQGKARQRAPRREIKVDLHPLHSRPQHTGFKRHLNATALVDIDIAVSISVSVSVSDSDDSTELVWVTGTATVTVQCL